MWSSHVVVAMNMLDMYGHGLFAGSNLEHCADQVDFASFESVDVVAEASSTSVSSDREFDHNASDAAFDTAQDRTRHRERRCVQPPALPVFVEHQTLECVDFMGNVM